jgi:hypothetical protein
MRFATNVLLAAATVLAASTADAQSSARRDSLLIPLTGVSTATGYSYNRTSRVAERDVPSLGLARLVESDLAALRNAQDAYFAKHATYATSLDQLPKLRVVSGATITLRDVTELGWTAEATHPSLPRSSFAAQVTRAAETP